jgi:hypothetical protein
MEGKQVKSCVFEGAEVTNLRFSWYLGCQRVGHFHRVEIGRMVKTQVLSNVDRPGRSRLILQTT